MKVVVSFPPSLYGLAYDLFIAGHEVTGHTETRLGFACAQQLGQELVIAEGGLDENLRLFLTQGRLLQQADFPGAIAFVYREVPVERKALPTETRRHQCQYNRTGTHQRDHLYATAVGLCHDVCTGVRNPRAARLTHQADILSRQQARKEARRVYFVSGMFSVIMQDQLVLGNPDARLFQEPAGGFPVFHDILINCIDRLTEVGRKRGGGRVVCQRYRNKVQRSVKHVQT